MGTESRPSLSVAWGFSHQPGIITAPQNYSRRSPLKAPQLSCFLTLAQSTDWQRCRHAPCPQLPGQRRAWLLPSVPTPGAGQEAGQVGAGAPDRVMGREGQENKAARQAWRAGGKDIDGAHENKGNPKPHLVIEEEVNRDQSAVYHLGQSWARLFCLFNVNSPWVDCLQ